MAQSVLLRARGLHTFKNPLSEIPEGSLEEALNIIIDRDGVIEPRRGVAQYTSTFNNQIKQIMEYKDRIIAHHGNKLIFEDSALDGTFNEFSGSFTEVESGLRIKYLEANGNFYFTTNEGIKKISASSASQLSTASGYITESGGAKALDLEVKIDASQAGFLEPLNKVAYRIVWGIRDANDNLILGSPSSRAVVENKDSVNSVITELNFPIPDDVNSTNYFYQVYRTGIIEATPFTIDGLANVDPGDEMNLVFEDFVTSADLTAGSITVSDITPEDFRANGALLYTNPVSGNGILQSNEPPPFARDLALYKGYTFYANTSTRQQVNISLLSVTAISNGDSITIDDGTTSRTYTFRGAVETYTADFSGMTFPGGKAALDGNYFTIASSNDETVYKVWFDDTGSTTEPTLAGAVEIKVDISATADTATDVAQKTKDEIDAVVSDFNISESSGVLTIVTANNGNIDTVVSETIGSGFSLSQDNLGDGEDSSINEVFLPRVPSSGENGPTTSQQLDQAARSLVRIINLDTTKVVRAFYLSGFNDVPGQFLLEHADLTGAQFNVFASNASVAGQFTPELGVNSVNEDNTQSNNEVRPNRVYYSKFQQPEAVPIINFLDVGPRDEEIERIVALRDSLFIFKEDGIYRLSGDIAPFSVAPFDFSLQLQAPDTAVVLNNQVHAFTTQGVAQVTDTGVNIISRDIENELLKITRDGFAFKTASFGVSYETDRSYLLWTVEESNDTVATQCFRYNSFTNTWTRWDLSKTCGLVNRRDDKLYLGASDTNIIEKERKGLDRTDYADREFTLSIVASGVTSNNVTLSSTSGVEIGDALIQTQYLTISQYNRLLKQLDNDPFVIDNDYFSTLEALPGASLTSKLASLAAKLDLDTGVSDTDYAASISGGATFPDQQSDFNIIVNKLNADAGVFFSDYDTSTGTVPVEAVITALNEDVANTVINNFSFPFIEGEIIHYKAIQTTTIWQPQTFGDPSILKQVREGTVLFENNNFTLAEIAYKSDLSPFFEEISFNGSGVGDWGQFIWSEQNWGGISSAKPLRTLIPLQKQRCRFLLPRFKHKVAFEKYSLFGLSLTVRPISERAYK